MLRTGPDGGVSSVPDRSRVRPGLGRRPEFRQESPPVTRTDPGSRDQRVPGRHSTRRRGLALAAAGLIAVALAACGSSSSATPPAATPAATTPVSATSQPAASAAASAAPSTAPSTAASGATGTIPSDPCSVVTAADIEAAFGGSSTAGVVNSGACEFQITGQMTAGKPDSPFLVRIGFVTMFSSFDTIKAAMGDAVTQVTSLGTPAWIALGIIHAQVAGGSLEVAALGIGTFDHTMLDTEQLAITKTVLGHL
jgi:hypothetical protein